MRFAFLVHYFPPINSSGAKRVEALSKYLVADGHEVTVITTHKRRSEGAFTEAIPTGVRLVELDWLGRDRPSLDIGEEREPMYTGRPSLGRRVRDLVMRLFGQLPDPRLPFACSIGSPWLAPAARQALASADVVIGSAPPWPMLLAAVLAKRRFKVPCILDYRDHFSECHEMPGGPMAKWLERHVDRWLLRNADQAVTISEPMARYYRTMAERVETIMNGYDHESIETARQLVRPATADEVVIRYMGIVSPGRVPHHFLEALNQFRTENPAGFGRIRVEYYGTASLVEQLLNQRYPELRSAFTFLSPVPYAQSMQRIVEADYLLFCETSSKETLSAQGILTTKLFEYIGSGRPILADISPESLAGSLLVQAGPQHVVGDSTEVFARAFRDAGFLERRPDAVSPTAVNLSRRAQSRQYSELARQVARPETRPVTRPVSPTA